MAKFWQLQEAKNKLSALVDLAVGKGPQVITRRGKEIAVVLSYAEYSKLQSSQQSLSKFFQQSPLSDISLNRDRSKLRSSDEFSA